MSNCSDAASKRRPPAAAAARRYCGSCHFAVDDATPCVAETRVVVDYVALMTLIYHLSGLRPRAARLQFPPPPFAIADPRCFACDRHPAAHAELQYRIPL